MNRATKCYSCENWDKCYKYIYGNKKQNFMTKIDRIKASDGLITIRVWECEKYVFQPNVPKKSISSLHNQESTKIYDIMCLVEDYFKNSGSRHKKN